MDTDAYWKRKLMLILFGLQTFLCLILIILSVVSLTTSSSYAGSVISNIVLLPVTLVVFISAITHFVVIIYSNAILGAVVFVNFVWTFFWLIVMSTSIVQAIFFPLAMRRCSNPEDYDDYPPGYPEIDRSERCKRLNIMIAAFPFIILSFIVALTIAIFASIAHRRYRRELHRNVLALRSGPWQQGTEGNPQRVSQMPPNMDPSRPYFQNGTWYQWQAVPVAQQPPQASPPAASQQPPQTSPPAASQQPNEITAAPLGQPGTSNGTATSAVDQPRVEPSSTGPEMVQHPPPAVSPAPAVPVSTTTDLYSP